MGEFDLTRYPLKSVTKLQNDGMLESNFGMLESGKSGIAPLFQSGAIKKPSQNLAGIHLTV